MFAGNLREAIRSVHVSYPVPFLATLLIVGGLCLIGLAKLFADIEQLVLVSLACVSILTAILVILKAVFFSPSLLKSERYAFFDSMIAVLGDNNMDPAALERLHIKMLSSVSERQTEKPPDFPGKTARDTQDEGDPP